MRGPDERFVNHGFIHSLKYWNGNQHKSINHNYNKIVKTDWLSTVPISALIGQCNRTARIMPVIRRYAPSHAWA